MNNNTIRLAGKIRESVVDGTGIRYVLFMQGCRHNCKNCFNPETHDFNGGVQFNIDEIVAEIKADKSRGLISGITCSGGDPMEQAGQVAKIVSQVRDSGFDVWLYTGYTFEHILDNLDKNQDWLQLMQHVDVLVDGKFVLEEKSIDIPFRGSKNQRLIDVKKSLQQNEVIKYDIH